MEELVPFASARLIVNLIFHCAVQRSVAFLRELETRSHRARRTARERLTDEERTTSYEKREAERNTLTHSKESAITMLNALTEAFLNVEIAEAQETTNDAHPAVQQNNPFTP